MMYGFGDAEQPDEDSVEVLEDIVVDYVTDLVRAPRILSSSSQRSVYSA